MNLWRFPKPCVEQSQLYASAFRVPSLLVLWLWYFSQFYGLYGKGLHLKFWVSPSKSCMRRSHEKPCSALSLKLRPFPDSLPKQLCSYPCAHLSTWWIQASSLASPASPWSCWFHRLVVALTASPGPAGLVWLLWDFSLFWGGHGPTCHFAITLHSTRLCTHNSCIMLCWWTGMLWCCWLAKFFLHFF